MHCAWSLGLIACSYVVVYPRIYVPDFIHPYDLTWAMIGLVGCAYPMKLIWGHIRATQGQDFAAMLLITGLYPTAIATFHLLHLDYGLVHGLLVFLPTLFFFTLGRYLDLPIAHNRLLKWVLYSLASAVAVMSVTNVWHGQFARFPAHVSGGINHLIFEERAEWGMQAARILAAVQMGAILVAALWKFSMARFSAVRYLVLIGLPGIALWSGASWEHPQMVFGYQINGFLISTTLVLISINFTIVARRLLELSVVTRATILREMPDAMLVLSQNRFISDANPALANLLGEPFNSCLGEALGDVLPDLDAALEEGGSEFLYETQRMAVRRIFRCTVREIKSAKPTNRQSLLLLRDITTQQLALEALEKSQRELRAANSALERLSMSDALTGLRNRRFFQDRLHNEYERLQRTGSQLALISIDIDHFKAINDSFGHAVGDDALCHVARVLESQSRSADTLARVGGEEFMVLSLDASDSTVRTIAQRLCGALRGTPYMLESGEELPITASVGVSIMSNQDSVDSALKRADKALYAAKKAGRDCMVEL